LLARTRLSTQDLSLSVISLQLVGLIAPAAGERYRRLEADVGPIERPSTTNESADSKTVVKVDEIESFKTYIIGLHGGISRKYSQLYAANYWCAMDQQRWGDGALMLACLRSEAKTREDILEFNSPGIIRVLPLGPRATK
ncbi:MAG: transposase, partial [Candidatus Obscuribacterales bacterium]|nr:transposase [Candidatus Obscuribacterales bacterium]